MTRKPHHFSSEGKIAIVRRHLIPRLHAPRWAHWLFLLATACTWPGCQSETTEDSSTPPILWDYECDDYRIRFVPEAADVLEHWFIEDPSFGEWNQVAPIEIESPYHLEFFVVKNADPESAVRIVDSGWRVPPGNRHWMSHLITVAMWHHTRSEPHVLRMACRIERRTSRPGQDASFVSGTSRAAVMTQQLPVPPESRATGDKPYRILGSTSQVLPKETHGGVLVLDRTKAETAAWKKLEDAGYTVVWSGNFTDAADDLYSFQLVMKVSKNKEQPRGGKATSQATRGKNATPASEPAKQP